MPRLHTVRGLLLKLDSSSVLQLSLLELTHPLVAFNNASFVTTLATAGTALLSLSFVFAGTAQEVLGSCIFLFVKHPYDIGDRVDISGEQLLVDHICLLYTSFRRVTTGKAVQIPNIVLNNLWIENVSRSGAMREAVAVAISFDTSFDDVQALRAELLSFVLAKENSRDFQPELEVELIGLADMSKLELRVEVRHKGNWHNEAVRAARRSRFMCALVAALRRVPIYAPGGGDAALGSENKPTYSVSVSEGFAAEARQHFSEQKDAKRLRPLNASSAPVEEQTEQVSRNQNAGSTPRAVPTYEPSRDGGRVTPAQELDSRLMRRSLSSGKRRQYGDNVPVLSSPTVPPTITEYENDGAWSRERAPSRTQARSPPGLPQRQSSLRGPSSHVGAPPHQPLPSPPFNQGTVGMDQRGIMLPPGFAPDTMQSRALGSGSRGMSGGMSPSHDNAAGGFDEARSSPTPPDLSYASHQRSM